MRSKPPWGGKLPVVCAKNDRLGPTPAVRRIFTRARHRSFVRIEPNNFRFGKSSGDSCAHPCPASDDKDTAAHLESLHDIRERVQPRACEALFVLAAVDPIQCLSPSQV